MVNLVALASVALVGFSALVRADDSAPKCGPNNLCPESAPCCSRRYFHVPSSEPATDDF